MQQARRQGELAVNERGRVKRGTRLQGGSLGEGYDAGAGIYAASLTEMRMQPVLYQLEGTLVCLLERLSGGKIALSARMA